jgi:cytochrome c oxidase cbb3-type subunit 3
MAPEDPVARDTHETECRFLGRAALLAALGAATYACTTEHAPIERQMPARAGRMLDVRTSAIQAGPAVFTPTVRNPFEGNVHAQREGQQLYTWFNCAGCHGAIGGGGMGPPLRDRAWVYGDSAGHIYQSIQLGRPAGMPAFANRISEDHMWKLVTFVQSLGGTRATEEPGAVASEPEVQQEGAAGASGAGESEADRAR